MRKALALGLCAALSWAVGTSNAEEKKFDAAKLVGKWTIASGEKNGEKVAEDNLKKIKIEIDKEKLTLNGDMEFVFSYKLDTSKKPVGISMTITKGMGEGTTTEGIIEVDGDTIKLCYAMPNEKAPKEFTGKANSGFHNFVLKRAK
jgi:uncharacterized protein (TIGR03067 family)